MSENENKTKDYVLRAYTNYRKKHTQSKTIQFHNEKDKDILQAVKKDKTPFSKTVKQLLRKHYNLSKEDNRE